MAESITNRPSEYNPVLAYKNDVVASLSPNVARDLKVLLNPETAWQPSSILPDSGSKTFLDKVSLLQDEARNMPTSLAIVVAGNGLTEMGLPLFTRMFNNFQPTRDISGWDETPWPTWGRGWGGEEKRHDDFCYSYILISGRFNTTYLERVLHEYQQKGFEPRFNDDPYAAILYPAWQERTAQLAHKRVSRLSQQLDISHLHKGAGAMAGDEGRHWVFYRKRGKELFEIDPDGTMLSFYHLIRNDIQMPGTKIKGFNEFVQASSWTGVYGPKDYIDIFKEFIEYWGIETANVSGEAAKAQEEILKRFYILSRLVERRQNRGKIHSVTEFNSPWVIGKSRVEGDIEIMGNDVKIAA